MMVRPGLPPGHSTRLLLCNAVVVSHAVQGGHGLRSRHGGVGIRCTRSTRTGFSRTRRRRRNQDSICRRAIRRHRRISNTCDDRRKRIVEPGRPCDAATSESRQSPTIAVLVQKCASLSTRARSQEWRCREVGTGVPLPLGVTTSRTSLKLFPSERWKGANSLTRLSSSIALRNVDLALVGIPKRLSSSITRCSER